MGVWEAVGYRPSTEQLAAHRHKARSKLVAGGERAGKSKSAAMELLNHLRPDRPGLYWIVGPTYDLARPEFRYVAEALQSLGIVDKVAWPRAGGCSILTRYGATVETKSADDPVKLAGTAPDGVLLCEAAQVSYETWLRLRGRIAEKRGWLWASGTFEGSFGWYASYWERWQSDNPEGGRSFSLPTWSNLAIYPGGRDDPEIRALSATYPADVFLERFGAIPCPPSNLVFREFNYPKHVAELPPLGVGETVEVAVDPGYGESAYSVLVIVRRGETVCVIDEVHVHGLVGEEVIGECKQRYWWPRLKTGVCDIAATQHHAMSSQAEVWAAHGIGLRYQPVAIEAGTERLHTFLKDPASKTGEPRVLFNTTLAGGVDGQGKPRGILAEFGLYRWRETTELQGVPPSPIDRYNDGIKALSYYLVDVFGVVGTPGNWKPIHREGWGQRR